MQLRSKICTMFVCWSLHGVFTHSCNYNIYEIVNIIVIPYDFDKKILVNHILDIIKHVIGPKIDVKVSFSVKGIINDKNDKHHGIYFFKIKISLYIEFFFNAPYF